jgi:hypothetical protein
MAYDDLAVGGNENHELRHARSGTPRGRAAADADDAGALFDHPLLCLPVGGRWVYLEPDLIAFQLQGTAGLCVLTSQHRHACIVGARAGIPQLLDAQPVHRAGTPQRTSQVPRRLGSQPGGPGPSAPPSEALIGVRSRGVLDSHL